jgi:hypothetical protein
MAAVAMHKQQHHHHHTERWADLLDDDGGDLDLGMLLPPPVVVGPDAKGIKTVTEYRIDGEGNKVKVTTTKRVRTVRRSRSAIERRSWPKFGDAAREAAGSRLTMACTEEILFDRTRATGRRCSILFFLPTDSALSVHLFRFVCSVVDTIDLGQNLGCSDNFLQDRIEIAVGAGRIDMIGSTCFMIGLRLVFHLTCSWGLYSKSDVDFQFFR